MNKEHLVIISLLLLLSCGQQKQHSTADQSKTDSTNTMSLEYRIRLGRAIEAVIWGMPAVNTDLMLQEMLNKTSGKVNQVVYWGRPMEWHNQTLTPNPDAIYFMAFFDTKNGPIVLDLPPGSLFRYKMALCTMDEKLGLLRYIG